MECCFFRDMEGRQEVEEEGRERGEEEREGRARGDRDRGDMRLINGIGPSSKQQTTSTSLRASSRKKTSKLWSAC